MNKKYYAIYDINCGYWIAGYLENLVVEYDTVPKLFLESNTGIQLLLNKLKGLTGNELSLYKLSRNV